MDQIALISSAEQQLKDFGNFLNNYDKKLCNLLEKSHHTSDENIMLQKNYPDLIKINYSTNQENLSVLKLIDSDRLLNKSILTFAYLCNEVDEIVVIAKAMQMKFLYIDEDLCTVDPLIDAGGSQQAISSLTNEKIIYKMGNSIEFLCNVQFLIQRCVMLANNMLHQCGASIDLENHMFDFKFVDVIDCLSNLVVQLLIFDEILASSNFSQYWPVYKKAIEAIARNIKKFDFCTSSEINGLLNCLQEFEFLFSGNIFQSFLDSTFTLKEKIRPKAIGHLSSQFNEYMKQSIATIEKFSSDLSEFSESYKIIKTVAFCVVFHDFCGQVETKHVKSILELNSKHMGITLIGNVMWSAGPFLKKHAETLMKPHERHLQEAQRQRKNFLNYRVQSLQRDCKSYCTKVGLWTIKFETALTSGTYNLKVDQIKVLAMLLLHGFEYAGQLSYIIKALVNVHVFLNTAMLKSTLLSVCKLMELLKIIQLVFQKDIENISKIMQCIIQYLQYKAFHIITTAKKIASTKMNDRNVDALAALKIAEKCLHGSATHSRILIAKLAINCTNANHRTLSSSQYEKFSAIVSRIELLASFQDNLEQVCDTSFLYWHQSLLSAYLKQIVEKKMDFNSFQFLVKSANDCGKALDFFQLGDLKLAGILKSSNFKSIKSEILNNLCAQIEMFLRVEVHSSLQLDKTSPFEQSINDYRSLISISPIEINGQHLILKDYVENYLSSMFYNLTTISLHDWKIYEEMRQLANHRLKLHPIEDYLPTQTLEQGIDVLEIMRNIHIFVSKYTYNMNTQIFVEHRSVNKHLGTIGISHIANSLRTHGTGIINTTVNFTYQFLRQKFYTFSQFLYDEQIRSRLMKEFRLLVDNKQKANTSIYTYERAESFNKDIRKLGLTPGEQSYMDLFRKVITHIGNAMGYIRLIRSGCIHVNYSASLYLPKFDDTLTFVEQAKKDQLHEVTVNAAENLEENIRNLSKSFSDRTDFFKILVDAFQPFFRNPNNIHLKNFYLIVPPLTLNYIEYILSAKEKITKKDRQEAVLFDDGFSVGLSYILKLLNQIGEFNSLQWFATMRDRFDAERRKVNEMQSEIIKDKTNTNKGENEKLQQTLALTERRINAHQIEFNWLYYNLSSAKIFFH